MWSWSDPREGGLGERFGGGIVGLEILEFDSAALQEFEARAPTYPLAFAAFVLVGALNAPFFTATPASRARYSPPEGRAQVFVSMAALKVGASSAGTAAAGAALFLGPRVLLLIGAAAILLTVAITAVDRQTDPARRLAATGRSAG